MEEHKNLTLPSVISSTFKLGQHQVTFSQAQINDISDLIQRAIRIDIRGRTDNSGEDLENDQLALNRALSAKRFMVDNGAQEHIISINYSAGNNFIADETTRAGKAINRRSKLNLLLKTLIATLAIGRKMNMNMKTTAFTLTIVALSLAGCNSSSGGGAAPSNASNGDANDILAVLDPTAPSTVISDDDVWNPSETPKNLCSAPYYEAVGGLYEGNIIADEPLIGSSRAKCVWEVDVAFKRVYAPFPDLPILTRDFCEFDVAVYMKAGPTPADYVAGPESDEESVEYDECKDLMFQTRYKPSAYGRDLSDPLFPIEVEIDLRERIVMNNESYPLGYSRQVFSHSIDFLISEGGRIELTHPLGEQRSIGWYPDVSKTVSDIGLNIEEIALGGY